MTAPNLGWEAFLDLAKATGCMGVEFRNDLKAALFGGADPAAVKAAVAARGLRFLALAEVKMFNDWSSAKAAEAEALMKIAVAAGAEAVSLIPRNDGVATDRAESRKVTETALRELLPMLKAHGLKAMVEPLGFASARCATRRCWPSAFRRWAGKAPISWCMTRSTMRWRALARSIRT